MATIPSGFSLYSLNVSAVKHCMSLCEHLSNRCSALNSLGRMDLSSCLGDLHMETAPGRSRGPLITDALVEADVVHFISASRIRRKPTWSELAVSFMLYEDYSNKARDGAQVLFSLGESTVSCLTTCLHFFINNTVNDAVRARLCVTSQKPRNISRVNLTKHSSPSFMLSMYFYICSFKRIL